MAVNALEENQEDKIEKAYYYKNKQKINNSVRIRLIGKTTPVDRHISFDERETD